MAATLKFYSIDKDHNSTKLPVAGDLVLTLTGDFKMPFNIMNPTVRIEELDPSASTGQYTFLKKPPNYVSVSPSAGAIQRYYWIVRWTWVSDKILDLELEEDVLATFKSEIGGSTQYVTRSASSSNGYLVDMMYPIEANPTVTKTDISTLVPWYSASPSLSTGCYVVGVQNDDVDAVGSVSYYVFPPATFALFRHHLMNDVSWATGTPYNLEISEALYKSLFDPMQYIASVKWFPMVGPHDTTQLMGIHIGWWPLVFGGNNPAFKLDGMITASSFNLATVNHPQASRGQYLQTPPFRQRTLYIEPFGSIELDTAVLIGTTDYPVVNYQIDWITGAARVRVTSQATGALMGEAVGVIGIDMTLSQVTQDLVGTYLGLNQTRGTIVSTALAGVTANFSGFATGMASIPNGLANALNSFMPTVQTTGSNGSTLSFGVAPLDVTVCRLQASADNTRLGSPLCRPVQISTLSGFTMCDRPHLDSSNMCLAERNIAEQFMRDGFFYE